MRSSSSQFLLPTPGIYRVIWFVQTTEPGQLQLDLDQGSGPVPLYDSTIGNQDPTSGGHGFPGNDYVLTVVVNAVLRVINPAGNTPALTITPADGASTSANVQSIIIEKLT